MAHILVVEDDLQFRQMLVHMLVKDGHEVTIASNGMEAMRWLDTIQPDLILTDILMPQMDGVEIILALSQSSKDIPIIAMSGGRRAISSQFNLESASLLGVKEVLTKPFSHADLRRVIGAMLP
ncbi:response regulator [Actimicrobium sp. CCI2.3]|uniref:response regulator n=1 Tax=Actimicrobium sp. CCI2.3 TaxID=3048616 RepID=UPI002AB49C9E|nr:response regulator [Actimicrobium sp. CCI2.3]MDY7574824.1 response regulator [Actimicrobium sp. CCI2.3]MEB0020215.1 response regulator [Actimicrobium sp. CCI2.3]